MLYKVAFSYNGLCEIINFESDPSVVREHANQSIRESGFDLEPDTQIDIFANSNGKWLKLYEDGTFGTRELSAADYTFQDQSDEEIADTDFESDPDFI